jgi:chromosome partitioning protein
MKNKPKIIVFAGQKGGIGKSTGARNTHVKDIQLGIKSILLDCDDSQHSSFKFNERREFFRKNHGLDVPALNVIKMNHKDLREGIVDYAKKFEKIIVDPGGRIDKETELAMAIADMLIMWCKYGQDEMDTFSEMNGLFIKSKNSNIPALIVPNEISTHYRVKPTQLHKLKSCAVNKAPLFRVTQSYICHRDAYQISRESGLAIFELVGSEKNHSANLEFNEYYKEAFNNG